MVGTEILNPNWLMWEHLKNLYWYLLNESYFVKFAVPPSPLQSWDVFFCLWKAARGCKFSFSYFVLFVAVDLQSQVRLLYRNFQRSFTLFPRKKLNQIYVIRKIKTNKNSFNPFLQNGNRHFHWNRVKHFIFQSQHISSVQFPCRLNCNIIWYGWDKFKHKLKSKEGNS